MWAVYRMTAEGWRIEVKGQSFQHACRLYDSLRESEPTVNFTINYAY